MNLTQLRALVKQGESELLEFKKTTGLHAAAMKTVCAFLNSETGGTVLFGVTNDGEIIGQVVADTTNKEIANELRKIEPHADIPVKHILVGKDKYVIVLTVKPGKSKPYMYDGRSYIRNQSTTQQMPREEYIRVIQSINQSTLSWDRLTTNNCTVKDLDKKRIREVARMAVDRGRLAPEAESASISEILEKLELLDDERLTNAAVVLFCKTEQKQFIQAAVQLARFEGVTKSVFLDRKDVRGNIFDLLESSTKFLNFNLPISGKIVDNSVYRVDTPALPYKVLREALLNALMHRDYSIYGGSIDIAIYDDRIEIDNPGNLPAGIELRDLIKPHKSIKRNPLIANVLYVCGMIEKWGRGTLEMITLCKETGNHAPKFEETSGSFSVIFPLKETLEKLRISAKKHELFEHLTDRQKEIISILQQGPVSIKLIMEQLTIPLALRTLQLELLKLKNLGFVAAEGTGRGRSVLWMLNAQ